MQDTPDPSHVRVDSTSREVWVDGEPIVPTLALREFDLLAALVEAPGGFLSNSQLVAVGWPYRPNGDVSPTEVEDRVRRVVLRTSLRIVAVGSYGYRLE